MIVVVRHFRMGALVVVVVAKQAKRNVGQSPECALLTGDRPRATWLTP